MSGPLLPSDRVPKVSADQSACPKPGILEAFAVAWHDTDQGEPPAITPQNHTQASSRTKLQYMHGINLK